MSEAHLFLLASMSMEGDAEGQGLVLQEAQACGLPVVATDHGAFPEGMLPRQSGFLVPEGDELALANQLRFLIEHSEMWPSMGRLGRGFVERHYDIRQLNVQLANLYARLIEEFHGARV
jgi:colanic acid/amylovoran biosynthesis glycosyltransferase